LETNIMCEGVLVVASFEVSLHLWPEELLAFSSASVRLRNSCPREAAWRGLCVRELTSFVVSGPVVTGNHDDTRKLQSEEEEKSVPADNGETAAAARVSVNGGVGGGDDPSWFTLYRRATSLTEMHWRKDKTGAKTEKSVLKSDHNNYDVSADGTVRCNC
jgi:hypothetical protein